MPGPIYIYNYLKQVGTKYATIDKSNTVTGIAPNLVVDTDLAGKRFVSFPSIKLIEVIYIDDKEYVRVTLSNTSKGFFGRKLFYLLSNGDVDVLKSIITDINMRETYKAVGELVSIDGVDYFKVKSNEPTVNAFWVDGASEVTTYQNIDGSGDVDTITVSFTDGTNVLIAI